MDNVVLGKLLKAMQKMSGKSITALSDESGLTVDTINNLFYARIQKPGFEGVCTLSEIMGFPVEKLLEFLKNKDLEDMEVAEITEFLAEDTEILAGSAEAAKKSAVSAKEKKVSSPAELDAIRETHAKELDRMRTVYDRSIDNLKDQRTETLRQMKESYQGLERTLENQIALLKEEKEKDQRFFEKTIQDNEKRYTETIGRLERTVTAQRKTISKCLTALIIIFIFIIVMLVVDRFCTDIGWFRAVL